MERVRSYLAGNANLWLDKSIKSESFPPRPHVGSQGSRQTIWMCLHKVNEPHYSAIVGKRYEDSNLNYLSCSPRNSIQSSKVSSHGLIYLDENNPIKNKRSLNIHQ